MSSYKKTILAVIGLLFATLVTWTALPARAQFAGPIMANIISSIPETKTNIWTKIQRTLDKATAALTTQLVNQTLSTFMNKLAFDLANNIATGGPGKTPLFERESFTKSLQTAKNAALGEFIGQISKNSFEDLGFNLCDPSLSVKLVATMSLIDSKAPPKPTCDWVKVQKEWAKFGDNFTADLIKIQLDTRGGSKNLDDFFANGFSLEQTDLGVIGKLSEAARQAEIDAVKAKEALTQKCQGYLDNKTAITEDIKTSCTDIQAFKNATFNVVAQTEAQKIGDSALAKEVGVIGQIMKTAGNIFVNTFTSKLMNKWLHEGTCSLLGGDCSNLFGFKSSNSNLRDNLLAQLRGGANVDKSSGASGLVTNFQKIEPNILESYNIFEEFAVCPEDPKFRTPDNCVVSSDFLQAISSRTTLQDAIDKGLINSSLPLIGMDDSLRNANKECYKDALCYSNLVKLRKANVIPVGWELAALQSPLATPVTIQQAVDCFEEGTGKCKFPVDSATGHNPFYHLVDPYWILKAPAASCNAYVYSPILSSPDTSDRQQYCADIKTCLREDANGNCIAGEYGYCTKSENIWRFTGDECKNGDIYAGCLTFQNDVQGSASYLEQSLDYCSSGQVGCKRYSQEQNNDGNWVLQDIATDDNDLFLNNKAASCPADMAGCSEYIVMAADTGTNLVANGSFSTPLASDNNFPAGWFRADSVTPSNGAEYDRTSGRIANGYTYDNATAHNAEAERFQQKVYLLPNTTYTLSVDAAQYAGYTIKSTARVSMLLCDKTGDCTDSVSSPNQARALSEAGTWSGNCVFPHSARDADLQFQPDGETMQRSSCTFTTNQFTYGALLNLLSGSESPTGLIWFDNLKLEIVSSLDKGASSYSDYGTGSKITIGGSRFMCTQDEVGCQGYTPSNGDPMIPAVISQSDLCPSECVGYATFAEAPDNFDLIEDANAEHSYYNFIPKTAQSCSAAVVGCEEFTNLDAVAQGGEGKEYYTYLRQCVSADQGTDYITWEGTDVAGYQIRAWKALPSNVSASATVAAPCTNILPGASTCSDTVATIAACGPETPSVLDDPSINANCRQFFDASGNSFYRLQDKVVFATDDCHDYRRTINSTLYRATPSQSTRCTAAQNGCRAYYGNTANNVRNIFSDDFERTSYAPWLGIVSDMTLSSESLENNGHSLKITSRTLPAAAAAVPIGAIQNKKQYQLSWWMKSSSSMSSAYWNFDIPNNTSGSLPVRISTTTDSSLINIAANNWQYYTVTYTLDLSTAQLANLNLNNVNLQFVGLKNAAGDPLDVFLDNVILKEVASNIYAIRNSWQTPISCDTPYTGYHLGCQTYTDTNRNSYNLRSFTSMCRVEAIGCMAAIDTHNSSNPFAETFHAGDVSSLTVPADSVTYLVPDNRKYCSATYKGCQALGLPDRTNPSYLPTVYKINNPDQYSNSLCMNADLGCEEYASDKGAYYFKDPGLDTCTYQSNVMVGSHVVTGWFKTANLKDPLPLGCLDTNNAYDEEDYALGSKVASCPADKNLCTAFYDPSDPASCDIVGTCSGCTVAADCADIANERECRAAGGTYKAPNCQAYYYYNNDKIDKSSCNGQVNKNNGCVLFKDANNWNADHSILNVNYDSAQSYALNLAQSTPVSPVTCNPATDTNCNLDSNVLVKVTKDRQCGEWLACRSSSVVWDKDNNRYKVVCSDMGICTKYDSTNNITKCAEWLPTGDTQALTLNNYQSRATGANDKIQFGDDDYTGYSIPNMLPMPALTVVDIGTVSAPNPQLVYDSGSSCSGSSCSVTLGGDQFTGVCYNNRCLVSPVTGGKNDFKIETRGYAQIDSPYPSSISPDQGRLDRMQAYAGANMCEVDQTDPIIPTPNGCETTYIKITYGGGGAVRYYPTNLPSPNGICSSGNTDGDIDCVDSAGLAHNNLCDTYNTDGSSRSDGVCDKKVKAETISNWPGICLEYDYGTKIVNDTNGTNYCNQWYPADQITGASSLFDNYREAGYYEAAGRDALFCAVTSSFVTYNERVYCLASSPSAPGECNALAQVPAGSKINAANLSSSSSVVSYGFLKDEAYTFVPSDGTVDDYPTNNGFPNGIGLDRIEKNGLENNLSVSYAESRFTANDFVLPTNTNTNQVPVTTFNILSKVFVPPTGEEIAVFYLDEDVNSQFKETADARIWIGDRLELAPSDPTNTTACYDDDAGGNTGPDDTPNDCDQGVQCDANKTWHSVLPRYCNPLSYNYYLRPIVYGNCAMNCSDTLVSGAQKGQVCLAADTAYTSITPRTGCAINDYSCKFVQCVESVHDAGSTHADGLIWCPDYGQIRYGTRVSDSGIKDVKSIGGCLAYLFSRQPIDIDAGFTSIYGLTRKNGISNALIQAAIGNTTIQRINSYDFYVETTGSYGCLESAEPATSSCTTEKGMSDVSLCPLSPITHNNYCSTRFAYMSLGSTCTGAGCYQQCQIVTQLDPNGDKSWVRTDIWWRNETGSGDAGRNNYPTPNTWLSYYYKSTFIQNANVYYSGITGENVKFSHFGSALGFLANDVVNVRVPVNATVFSPLSAVTFYASSTTSLSAGQTMAKQQLAYIFYRVYNLKWDPTTISYVPDETANIYTGAATNQNTQAGADFDPVILQVCGNDVCRDTSANGVTEGITINDLRSDNVYGHKSLFASIKFYYYAHPDHMPIKNIAIDWGDASNDTSAPGKYKNNIPDCNPDTAMPGQAATTKQGFGGTDRACREAYKTFYHDYQYDPSVGCVAGIVDPGVEASCYKPTVTVQDHWYTTGTNYQSSEDFDAWIVVYKD